MTRIETAGPANITWPVHDNRDIVFFYDQEAGVYDEGYSTPLCQFEDEILMDHLLPVLRGKVVDIGCGTGLPLEYLKIPDYHGIDISPMMIAKAKQKFPGVDFRVGDMHELPFANEEIDTLISLYGPFSYSLRPRECLGEFCRVLKPGGHLAIMPYTRRVEKKLFIGGYSTAVNPDIPKIHYSSAEIANLFEGQPFQVLGVHGINYFANMIEAMSRVYGNQHPPELYQQLLAKEKEFDDLLPVEYARHALIIARKN